ncbi:hypothetical protein [Haliangium sp.]|uniref:hypothetical protein n=1 Tax=Haliangium sp. TaxID=2663208 RepID=UPI003D0980B2
MTPGRALATAAALTVSALLGAGGCRDDQRSRPDPGATLPVAGPRPTPAPPSLEDRIDRALVQATSFLLAQQGDDGSFRSQGYGAFRDGYSLTPLALTALGFVHPSEMAAADAAAPELTDQRVKAAYRRGVDFVATLVDEEGEVQAGLDGPSYPYYAIPEAILVLNAPGNERHRATRATLLEHLRARQLTEDRGWTATDVSYGGWSYFPGRPDKDATGGRPDPRLTANLSVTLYSLGAMRLAGIPATDPALVKARGFVERCQNLLAADADPREPYDDGGFFFSPAVPDSNKAGVAGVDAAGRSRYRSYGSMTADGLRALVRLGLPMEHPRVRAASAWLTAHFDPSRNPGEFPAEAEVRRESSYYYYVWSAAHALRAVGASELALPGGREHWARALAEALLARQREDGAWANEYTELREDDPLLATPFAMAALLTARMVLAGTHQSHSATPP